MVKRRRARRRRKTQTAMTDLAKPETADASQDPPGLTRRDFLVGSGLAVAALANGGQARAQPGGGTTIAETQRALGPAGKVRSPVRLAVVGGNFGAQFYWHEHPDCKVVAVSDLVPERLQYLKETFGCERGYESLEDLLADETLEYDAVAVFTEATQGVEHVCACVERGKHVIAGSPAAMSLDEARRLRAAVVESGCTYMLGETSYYQQSVISARKWYQDGEFGNVFSCEAEYHHPGLEKLFVDEQGKRTWRYGLPPMLYSTHCTGHLLGVTGERLKEVSCYGWGDNNPILRDNAFKNPFWGETALFQTERGNAFRAAIYWRGALGIAERAVWMGEKMSFFPASPNGGRAVVRRTEDVAKAAAAAGVRKPVFEKYDQVLWWQTHLLPEPLRHISGHEGSHTFLTHAFIDALVKGERPAMDVDFALDLALPGLVAHESALNGGKKMVIPRSTEL
jgi:predicted dehydrogenase